MPITFTIDSETHVPPFDQVKHTVIQAIQTQQLAVNEKLPAIRALAADLGLAVNTVARSYRELEEEGYVETRGRSGTRVSATAVPETIALTQITREYASKVRGLGLGHNDAVEALAKEFQQ